MRFIDFLFPIFVLAFLGVVAHYGGRQVKELENSALFKCCDQATLLCIFSPQECYEGLKLVVRRYNTDLENLLPKCTLRYNRDTRAVETTCPWNDITNGRGDEAREHYKRIDEDRRVDEAAAEMRMKIS